ncbi:MarR family winged helix-turn-helix transcriptional regulator [Nitrincola alkalisediminis]|uniref:MarR family winged helix-turn-helix transcriptional regulator n=1 Tax=Nitrincola alkalisediminis TaxID=1366656 RepID=UPI0018742E48|nr:MarR family transcriptional regulator [Nitrincola alkalisediminis]
MDIRPSLQRLEWHLWNQWRERAQHNDHLELTNSELQYVYILLAWSETGLRLTELAELMQVSKASASSMISKLEKRGYLSRQPCSEDARAQRLLPTIKAMTLKQEEPRVYQAAVRHFEQVLSAEELQQLTVLLDKACRDLDLGDLYPPQLFQSPYNI